MAVAQTQINVSAVSHSLPPRLVRGKDKVICKGGGAFETDFGLRKKNNKVLFITPICKNWSTKDDCSMFWFLYISRQPWGTVSEAQCLCKNAGNLLSLLIHNMHLWSINLKPMSTQASMYYLLDWTVDCWKKKKTATKPCTYKVPLMLQWMRQRDLDKWLLNRNGQANNKECKNLFIYYYTNCVTRLMCHLQAARWQSRSLPPLDT